MSSVYLVGDFILNRRAIKENIYPCFNFNILKENVYIPFAEASFQIETVIKHIGEIVTINSEEFIFAEFNINSKASSVDIEGIVSYACFFQLAYTIKNYTHLHDIKTLVNLYQSKIILYNRVPVGDLKVFFELEDVFFKKDICVKVDNVIGTVNIVKRDISCFNRDLFVQETLLKIKDTFFDYLILPKWKVYELENDFKNPDIFTLKQDNLLKNFILEYDYSALKQNNEEFENGVYDIESCLCFKFTIEDPYTEVQMPAAPAHFNLSIKSLIKGNIYGAYHLATDRSFIGGELYGPIEVVLVQKSMDGFNYKIVNIENNYYKLLDTHIKPSIFVNIGSFFEKIGVYITPKNLSFNMVKASISIIEPTFVDLINSMEFPLLDMYVIIDAENTDIKDNMYFLLYYKTYEQTRIVKEGVYRNIVFNKFLIFNFEHVPFYKFNVLFLSDFRYFPFTTEIPSKKLFYIKEFKFLCITIDSYLRIENFSSYPMAITTMKKQIIIQNEKSFIWIYNLFNKQLGYIKTNETYLIADLLSIFEVFNSKEYRYHSYILYTQIQGIFVWSEETINKSLNYMNKEKIREATEFIRNANVYPYGILRIYSFNSLNPEHEYLNLTNNNLFNYNNTFFIVDVSSVMKLNDYKKVNSSKIVNLSDFNRMFVFNTQINKVSTFVEKELLILRLVRSGLGVEQGVFLVENNLTATNNLFCLEKPWIVPSTAPAAFVPVNTIDTTEESISYYAHSIKNNIYYFVSILTSQDIGGFDMEIVFKIDSNLEYIGSEIVQCDFSYTNNFVSNNVFMLGEFKYKTQQNILSSMYRLCDFKYTKVLSLIKGILSAYSHSFTLNKGIESIGGHIDKWATTWMQLFIPTAADISDISIKVFELIPSSTEWTLDIPLEYRYVNDKLQGFSKPIPKKADPKIPSISLKEIEADPLYTTKTKIPKEELCKEFYKMLDNDGFTYEIESDDKLLIGNYVYKIKKDFYGGDIKEVASSFVKNRYASDIDIFKNTLIEILEAKTQEPIDENFTIDKFELTAKDFNNQISEEALEAIQNQIDAAQQEALQEQEKKSVRMSIDEYIAQHPEMEAEIKQYIDDLNMLADAYVWEGNPARTPIDGKLFKKVKMSQIMEIKPRTIQKEEDV